MKALMQDRRLISSLIEHANTFHAQGEIGYTVEGPIDRCTYGDIHRRSKQVANALTASATRPATASARWRGTATVTSTTACPARVPCYTIN